jgi:hypothetical protein
MIIESMDFLGAFKIQKITKNKFITIQIGVPNVSKLRMGYSLGDR